MNVEQRLIEVFETSPGIEPSADLFSRVVHSIEEDRRHRQRVVRTLAALAAAVAAVVVVGAMSIVDARFSRHIDRATMEALEAVVLISLLATLGPAIRRFGRNYAADLWPRGAVTPGSIQRLLDLAYYLVGAGFILSTVDFDFSDRLLDAGIADQMADASMRIGAMMLMLGLLHATTLFILPVVALIDNSTRAAAALPRWIWLLLVLAGLAVIQFLPIVAIGAAGSG